MSIKIAVVGATGKVGQEILKILSQFDFKMDQVYAVASDKSANKSISFGDEVMQISGLSGFDFSSVDIAIFALSHELADKYVPKATESGCIVIDNSSRFRMDPEVPLVVPEVNAHDIADFRKKNIIANPNCSTIQLVVALHPLHKHIAIEKVVVSTYQSVSGAGKDAMDELYRQTKSKYMLDNVPPLQFTRPIAFNLIPHIDDFMDGGYTREELKMRVETQKIMDSSIMVEATCVRVPVFIGHSEAVHIEFSDDITVAEAAMILKKSPGIILANDANKEDYITPIEVVGEDYVFISRLRQHPSRKNTLNMWIVSDNLRKGAALNAVQIMQHLVKHYL